MKAVFVQPVVDGAERRAALIKSQFADHVFHTVQILLGVYREKLVAVVAEAVEIRGQNAHSELLRMLPEKGGYVFSIELLEVLPRIDFAQGAHADDFNHDVRKSVNAGIVI